VDSIAFGNGKFIATGSDSQKRFVSISPDGEMWYRSLELPSTFVSGQYNVVFAGAKFLLAAVSNKYFVYSSDLGVNWQIAKIAEPINDVNITYGNDKYILLDHGNIRYSQSALMNELHFNIEAD